MTPPEPELDEHRLPDPDVIISLAKAMVDAVTDMEFTQLEFETACDQVKQAVVAQMFHQTANSNTFN